ncbi:unnamed protein product [Cylicocyclus nassatus]|uniref:Uncharacterized protein n=1 Tax=Cylicocyclus nassatus TaxID=53992 RepID=A0AA36H1X4_CYLNA|nr:unnamed protein product [Cylicocyclus nassatus]
MPPFTTHPRNDPYGQSCQITVKKKFNTFNQAACDELRRSIIFDGTDNMEVLVEEMGLNAESKKINLREDKHRLKKSIKEKEEKTKQSMELDATVPGVPSNGATPAPADAYWATTSGYSIRGWCPSHFATVRQCTPGAESSSPICLLLSFST